MDEISYIDIIIGLLIGVLIMSVVALILQSIERGEMAEQFCESKGLELVEYDVKGISFEWIDCQESNIVKTNGHTFSWE